MTLRGVRVTLLCEDRDHERFVVHYLRARGVDISRHFRVLPLTSSRGSGEQHVRVGYAKAVRAQRSKAHDVGVSLVVMTDADQLSVAARRASLDEALNADGQPPRTAEDRIVLLIPKRNVETWVTYLNGSTVDEASDYKPQAVDAFKTAANLLQGVCAAAPPPAGRPPSLSDACTELSRLDA